MRRSSAAAVCLVAALAVLATSRPARAHHSFAAEFDMDKPVTITGTVSKMAWTNPHAWMSVDVTDKDGKVVTWEVEFGVPNALYRQGMKRSDFPVGGKVTVNGFLSRTQPHIANGVTVITADGRKLLAGSSFTGSPTSVPDEKK